MGKKDEINPFTVSELQIFSCHGIANLAHWTQIVHSDYGIVGKREYVYLRKSACYKMTLANKHIGLEASSFDSESKHLISLATCGPGRWTCCADGSEHQEGLKYLKPDFPN